MTIEIRELVIEARVIAERPAAIERMAAPAPNSPPDEARWIERIVRRVLEALDERRERQ